MTKLNIKSPIVQSGKEHHLQSSNNFDFLRFFFAFIVILAHLIDLSRLEWLKPYKIFVDSQLAVAGFFVISGHLIYGSYLRSKSVKTYFINRAKRLLPAYTLLVLAAPIMLCLMSSYSLQSFWTHSKTFTYLLANLSFLNFLEPCLPGVFTDNAICAVNGALWTIKIEIGFYLSIPILVYLMKRFQSKQLFYALLYGSSLSYHFLITFMGNHNPQQADLFRLLEHQLPAYFTYFAAGMLLHDFKTECIKLPYFVYIIALCDLVFEYRLGITILFPLSTALFVIWVAYHFPVLNRWGKHGDISYGIYLIHFPLIQVAVQLGFFQRYPFGLVAITLIVIVLCLAFLSWHLLEKRFLRMR